MLNLLLAIKNHKCVKKIDILEFIEEKDLNYFKIKAILQDNSWLYIREVVTPHEDKYFYHWVSPEEKFLLRWDNAPHWDSGSNIRRSRLEKRDIINKVF